MLQHKKSFHHIKTFVISVIAVSLAACSDGTETSDNTTDSASSSPSSLPISSSPQSTDVPANVTIPGVSNVGEIKFKPTSPNAPNGFFDTVNNSTAPEIEVADGTPITIRGWAILANEGRPPDSVIITSGDNNSLVALAPVNLERPDVVKVLKNPAYKNSGWSTTFNSSTLPANQVVLKAWAYNSASKEATQLSGTHEVVVE